MVLDCVPDFPVLRAQIRGPFTIFRIFPEIPGILDQVYEIWFEGKTCKKIHVQ